MDSDSKPKSKLAALAAARRKKENQKGENDAKHVDSSAAMLNRLIKTPTTKVPDQAPSSQPKQEENSNRASRRTYPIRTRQRKDQQKDQLAEETHIIKDEDSSSPPASSTAANHTLTAVPSSNNTTPSPFLQSPPAVASPSHFASMLFTTGPVSNPENPVTSPNLHFFPAYGPNFVNFDAFAGPSPDDVVLKAQGSKGPKSSKPPQTKATKRNNAADTGASEGVAELSISERPKVRSKNLDVVKEYANSKPKNAASFVVVGHVDAGKSTLMGRLLHDLKVVDQRTIDKYRKEASKIGKSSFALAWVLDEGSEERARGVTIDIATNQFSTPTTLFTILDAPGHRDFIPNMIAGAAQADFALLVLDADTGNFESGLKGQTKEHVLLVRSIGVQQIVVAINKLDAIHWSEDRFREIQQQTSGFLTAAGFSAKNISFIPCSGLTGENVIDKSVDTEASWYRGPTLLAALEPSTSFGRSLDKPLRMTIDDVFRGGPQSQSPISIVGRIEQGTLQIGDSILALPAPAQQSQQPLTIKSLSVNNEPADWAVAGQIATLNLTDITEPRTLRPGDVICHLTSPVPCSTSFKVKILAFEHVMPMQCEILRGRLHAPGKVTKLIASLDKATGAVVGGGENGSNKGTIRNEEKKGKKKPRLVKPGEVARIQIEVEEAAPLEVGSRVVLRAGGETIAAGLVE